MWGGRFAHVTERRLRLREAKYLTEVTEPGFEPGVPALCHLVPTIVQGMRWDNIHLDIHLGRTLEGFCQIAG